MKRIPTIILYLASMTLVQCATAETSSVPVSLIKGDPIQYVGEVVYVQGEVTKSFQIPFFDVSLYLLSDDEATMAVIGRGEAPESGDLQRVRVEVTGITSERSADAADSAVSAVADFLVDQGITDPSVASTSAARIVDFVARVAGFAEGSYLLVEQ